MTELACSERVKMKEERKLPWLYVKKNDAKEKAEAFRKR